MKNDYRSIATLCIMLLAGAAMFLGCSSSPTSVDSNVTTPSVQVTEVTSCPTIEEASIAIVAELDLNCPRTRSYRHWGDENSCEKSTIGKWLDQYDGCFSSSEKKQLRIRVEEMRHSAGTGDGGSGRMPDQPTPTQE